MISTFPAHAALRNRQAISGFSSQRSLAARLSRAHENENENNEETSVILLIQSMKNFSLLRTTDGDCYRVVAKSGGECEARKLICKRKFVKIYQKI